MGSIIILSSISFQLDSRNIRELILCRKINKIKVVDCSIQDLGNKYQGPNTEVLKVRGVLNNPSPRLVFNFIPFIYKREYCAG